MTLDMAPGAYVTLGAERKVLTMKTREISDKTGLKERTIRFYEEQGLLKPKMEYKNGRNFREYTEADAERLKTIATLRRSGFTIEELRSMLEHNRTVEEIFPVYLRRVQQEAETAAQLRAAAQQIQPRGLSPRQLAQALEQSTKNLELPPLDVSPHFGRFDTETPEEKQKAIAAYHARQNRKRLTPAQWALTILSLVCVVLAIGCAAVVNHYKEVPVEPEPSGSIEGWIYYKAYQNGTYCISRYEEATGTVERLYESQENTLAFLVTEDKIYISDGGTICSVNADGTGKYEICEGAYASINGRMVLHDGWLYVTTGLVGHASQIARVPAVGGEIEELELANLTDFEIVGNTLYTDCGGEIILLDLTDMTTTEYETGTSPQNVTIQDGVIYEMDLWSRSETNDAGSVIRVSVFVVDEADELVLMNQWELDALAEGGVKYVHDGRMYYTVSQQGGVGNDTLYALDMMNGEKMRITEVAPYSSPGIYWGEKGMIVADSADAPQYIMYEP